MAAVADVILNVDAKGAAAELNKVDSAAKGLNGTFNLLKGAIAGLGVGLAVQSIANVGKESEASKLKLQALTSQYGELNVASQSVDRIQKTLGLSAIEARDSYAQLYGSLRGTGLSAQQLEVLFVGLNKAAKLSGGGAQEAQAGIMQLKQAFSAGTLSGDELRSTLENMPIFAQAVGKELDRMGVTSNASAADIKRLGAEGKITSDILFKAAQNLSLMKAPPPTTAERFSAALKDLQEKIAEAFGPAAISLITKFTAIISGVGDWFKNNQAGVAGFAKGALELFKILGPLALGIKVVASAYELWTNRTKALAVAQAFLQALTGPKGIAMVAAAAGVAAIAYNGLNTVINSANQNIVKQKNEATAAEAKFKQMATTVDTLPNKTAAAAEAAKKYDAELAKTVQSAKDGQLAIEAQIKALDQGASITSARYEAEKAFNDLRGQQLERAYQLATTEEERKNIAIEIFNNSVQAAKIEYNQALERINLEREKLRLQYESHRLKLQEIKAEGERAKIGVMDETKLNKINEQTRNAISSQEEVTKSAEKTYAAQQQIAQYQEQAAKAQYETKILAAQTALEQKLVSQEIGLSQQQATQLSNNLTSAISPVQSLAQGTGDVASNAQQAAYMFIKIENNAQSAANAINAAASAQERLNAAKAKGGGGGGGGGGNAQGAAAGAYWKGGFKAFAKGGMVNKPTLGLIGEGGEPEYIIPESKAKNFAMNYLMGARGAGAIPKFAEGGYAGPSSASVSIQTGPVMQMNGGNYVTTAQMQQAVQAGVDRTLALIAGDQNMRRSVGIY